MRAVPVEKTIIAGLVPVENEILAQQAHGLRRLVVQLSHRGDGHPVAPQQLSHRRASADLRQPSVLFFAQHRFGSFIAVCRDKLSRGVSRNKTKEQNKRSSPFNSTAYAGDSGKRCSSSPEQLHGVRDSQKM